MRKKFADNKGSAEFSLITAIVLTGVADLLLLTAICKGFFETGEVGKRGCYAQVQEMRAQEQEEEQEAVTKDPDLAGGANKLSLNESIKAWNDKQTQKTD